jgi:hypothetical protein
LLDKCARDAALAERNQVRTRAERLLNELHHFGDRVIAAADERWGTQWRT